MSNTPNTDYPRTPRIMKGRRVITTSVSAVTAENIVSVITAANTKHQPNRLDIQYLEKYYRGMQPILGRVKLVRPEINHLIVENRANQIVNFKVGYCFGEPIHYVSTNGDEAVGRGVAELNALTAAENKDTKDTELAMWMHICGTGYRFVYPDEVGLTDPDDAPFELATLDPRNTYVVYNNGPGKTPVLGVTIVRNEDDKDIYCCYTPYEYFEVEDGVRIIRQEGHILGAIPIIEYPLNPERMGCFEAVLPLLDAINETASDRQNGLDQFIQALMVMYNVDIDDKDYKALREQGLLKLKDSDPQFKAKVEYLLNNLDQNGTETLIDHQYQSVLEIVGMPNRNGGSSTSDTGVATIVRDGWSDAEARAKNTEKMFKASEKEMLKIVLRICKTFKGIDLRIRDLDIQFTRRNYENIAQKATVLTQMLGSDKIAPKLASAHCGMFADPDRAYNESVQYIQSAGRMNANEQTQPVSTDGGDDPDDIIRSRESVRA